MTMVGVAIKKPDAGNIDITRSETLSAAMIAVLQIVLAFGMLIDDISRCFTKYIQPGKRHTLAFKRSCESLGTSRKLSI